MEVHYLVLVVLLVSLAACGDDSSPSSGSLQTPPTLQSSAAETEPEAQPPSAPVGTGVAAGSVDTVPADQQTAPPAAAGGGGETVESTDARLKREAGEWMKETKELGSVAWDATKEKSSAYYEAAKEKSAEYYATIKEKSGEYYEATKEKGAEYYETGKQEDQELYDEGNADVELREGHPPAIDSR